MKRSTRSAPRGITLADLPDIQRDPARPNVEPRRPSLHCDYCGESYSATPGDYFWMAPGDVFTCANGHDARPMRLVSKVTTYQDWGKA